MNAYGFLLAGGYAAAAAAWVQLWYQAREDARLNQEQRKRQEYLAAIRRDLFSPH